MHTSQDGSDAAGVAARTAAVPRVEVVRSTGRRRSSSAAVRDGRVVVRIPAHLRPDAADRVVIDLLGRLRARAEQPAPACSFPRRVAPARSTRQRRGPRGDRGLVARADAVAARWLPDHDVHPASVTWSHRMTSRWASITIRERRIRVSHRVADAPAVVLDVLLLHELAHVVEHGHGPAFHALARRHPDHAEVDAWLSRRTQDELRDALGLPPRSDADAAPLPG